MTIVWCLMLCSLSLVSVPKPASALSRLAGRATRSPHGQDAAVAVSDDPLAPAAALDLLACCLRAGMPTATALGAIAAVAPPELSRELLRVSELLAMGADPERVWRVGVDRNTPKRFVSAELAALGRLARQSAGSGSGMAEAVADLAVARRHEIQDAAVARAERAGVLLSGPLGLCFLPAFLCVGLLPTIIGLAHQMLGAGW